ncbi:aminoglycoside phosphotransferase family protein [Streptomyces sp. NBC_01218]|uniref:aminoglycoside phosphotransferase family protein n=1 Tax=unclassified Streptomyces TaxID=2593676 RepID=UPI0023B91A95|nr:MULTISPECIES: aminoglycoside phosphotransferase family protein [unclassified Streptomyces]WEH40288.1 aminoglycoside phosphotransferase family protein [Streptomyces sp. AM 2-1-1]WSQ51981.1 aminoglycoside phosphotransferase family protein [Streptomyces sp. NBC_01218]
MLSDEDLVRALVAAQFPQWAGLPVRRTGSHGTVNAVYRLGGAMAVRLPLAEGGARDAEKEHHWLPRLATHLPVPIPAPLAQGEPGEGYPWPWTVCRWLEGEPLAGWSAAPGGEQPAESPDALPDGGELASDLAQFVAAMRCVDPAGAPPAYRSEPLAARDSGTRRAIGTLRGALEREPQALRPPAGEGRWDAGAALAVWEAALRAPAPGGPVVWSHGDLQPGNVLIKEGRLGAVIDFGCMGLADPALDLIAAWYLLPAPVRPRFRTALGADDATWSRARGWALSIALPELVHHRTTNPVMAAHASRVIGELLAEGTE